LEIRLDSLAIVGRDTFEGISLFSAPQISIDINLLSLIGSNKVPEVSRIQVKNPDIHLVILDSATANYQIMPASEDTTSAPFHLALESYSLEGGTLTYQDNTMPLFVSLKNVSHAGKGDFTQDVFDLTTETTADSLHVTYAGTEYLAGATAHWDAAISIDVPQQKVTFQDNAFVLNELNGTFTGFFQMNEDEIITDMAFKTVKQDFKSFLSIVPGAFTKDFGAVKCSGKASLEGSVKGSYNELRGTLPGFSLQIGVDNGSIKYPGLPRNIDKIYADIRIKAAQPDYSDLTFDVRKFSLASGTETLAGTIYASNLSHDQRIEGNLTAGIHLENLSEALPMESIQQIQGHITGKLDFKAKMSDVNQRKFDKIVFHGSAQARDLVVHMKDKPTVRMANASLTASPALVQFDGHEIYLGKSDLSVKASVDNPLAIFSTQAGIQLQCILRSRVFDANEWMPTDAGTQPSTTMTETPDQSMLENSNLSLDMQCKELRFNTYDIRNLAVKGKIAANYLRLETMSLAVGSSDLTCTGYVANAWDYLFAGATLDGKIDMKSRFLNMNQFMANQEAPASATSSIPVPERVRLQVTADIDKLQYTNLSPGNVKGTLRVMNSEAALRDLSMDVLGGKLELDGVYSTLAGKKPAFSVKLNLANMPFNKAVNAFESMAKFAPIAKHIEGMFNSTLIFSGEMGQEMMPAWESINASGYLETIHGLIKGISPFSHLSEKLGVKELRDIQIKDTRNWFDIVNGTVDLKEHTFTEKGIDMTVSGKLALNREMDFTFVMSIPRKLLQSNAVTAAANQALTSIEKEAGKLGINIQQGPNIYIKVNMTGVFPNVKWKVTPIRGTGGAAPSADSGTGFSADSLKKKMEEKARQAKDTLISNAEKEAQKVKQKAEKEVSKAVDSISSRVKKEAGKQLDSLGKGVIPDTLRKKAKEILDKKSTEEVDKIKDKLKDFNPFKKKGNR
jgi:hypothetical protein